MSPPKKPKPTTFTTELVRSLCLPDGSVEKVDYDPSKPAEVAEADRVFAELKKSVSAIAGEVDHLEQASEPPLRPRPDGKQGPTISRAFAEFCAEKKQSLAWKDPEHARAL